MPIVIATSFADPEDVARYKKAIADGKTEEDALAIGDNGIGAWGDVAAREEVPMSALPPEDWLAKWGSGHNARGKKSGSHLQGQDCRW